MRVAIIGAGLSGCVTYKNLKEKGYEVTLFDKARGVGGRISTKYVEQYFIDHGTAFFEADDKEFEAFCDLCRKENLLRKEEKLYIPTKGINKIASALIDRADFIKETRISKAYRKNNLWILEDEKNNIYKDFDLLIITIPTPQILQMHLPLHISIRNLLQSVTYDADAAIILHGKKPLNMEKIQDASLRVCIDNSEKYQYKDGFHSYVIHASTEISNSFANSDKQSVQKFLCDKLFSLTGEDICSEYTCIPHLWRYAFVKNKVDLPYWFDSDTKLALCGDFFGDKGLQSAYLSASHLSKLL